MSNIKRFFAEAIEHQADQVDEQVVGSPEDSPSALARLLETDDETASRVLLVLDSTEEFHEYKRQVEQLLPMLGTEGFVETAKEVFAAIINWMKVVAAAIFDEMATHELAAQALSFKAANLKARSRDRGLNVGNQKPLVIEVRVHNLSSNYKPIKDVSQLIGGLRYMRQVAELYYGYVDGVTLSAGQLAQAAQTTPDTEQLATMFERHSPVRLKNSPLFKPADVEGVYQSFHMLGGYRLTVDTKMAYDARSRVKSTTARLKTSSDIPLALPDRFTIPRFNLGTSDTCLDTIIGFADYLSRINTLSTRQRRQQKIREVIRVLENLQRQLDTPTADATNTTRIKEAAELLESLTDWISNPYIGLYSLACRNLRAALKVCELNVM
jgi:hypothetical protein